MALAYFRSACGSSKSRKTFPLPSARSKSRSFIAAVPFSIVPAECTIVERCRTHVFEFPRALLQAEADVELLPIIERERSGASANCANGAIPPSTQ